MTGTKSLPSFVLILLIPLVAAVVLPIGNLYTSRILPPQPFALTPPAIWLTAAGTVLVALCFCRRLYFAAALGSALLALGLLHLIARQGESYPIGSLPAAGGWISLTALVILIWRSTDQCRPAWRCALYGLTAAMALIAEQSDLYAGLSVVRTYAARHDEFWQLFGEHCTLAAVSLLAAATLGMALGSLTAGRPGWGNLVEKLLTLSQTIPTISLLALFVSTAFIAGLSGLGPAPAVAALALYAMFPVTTATRSGLGQIRLKYAPSATALGLKGWQRLLFIELPLAGGTLLSGIRTAVNQTVGGAVLAAYVGAGGLGVYVMSGVIQSSPDLILLGTIPIGFLLLAGDGLLVAAIAIWQQRIGDRL